MKNLLFVAHLPSPNTQALAQAINAHLQKQIADGLLEQTRLSHKLAGDTQADNILDCDGLILFTTENFGYMSGMVKDMFERIYYPCLEPSQGKPFVLIVRAGKDGTGTVRSVNAITKGLAWKTCAEPLILKGDYRQDFCTQAQGYALTFATAIDMGIY